jgi:hypothetical protein
MFRTVVRRLFCRSTKSIACAGDAIGRIGAEKTLRIGTYPGSLHVLGLWEPQHDAFHEITAGSREARRSARHLQNHLRV